MEKNKAGYAQPRYFTALQNKVFRHSLYMPLRHTSSHVIRLPNIPQISFSQSVVAANALEKSFVSAWTEILKEHADVFTGIYAGVWRTAAGKNKKPGKTLKEWNARTRYQWENEEIEKLCERTIFSAIQSEKAEVCAKWAALLLEAASQAGIIREERDEIVLDETNIQAYAEWDDKEIYPDDRVSIIQPAWTQNGRVVEQGYCRLISEKTNGEEP